jgi:hypothetical protein
MCTCIGDNRCDYHRELATSRREAALKRAARDFTITDEEWHQLVSAHETDDLDRLLGGAQ